MSDWVHCNTCYKQPGGGKKFHLTNCGHIYCDVCVGTVKETKCHICGNRCTTILLAAKMKPDVEIFFLDPRELYKKQFRQLQKIDQVMEFQKNHRTRLAAYNREMFSKQDLVMHKAQHAIEQVRALERENKVLIEEIIYLKKLLSSKGTPGRSSPLHRQGSVNGSSQNSPQNLLQAKMSLSQPSQHPGHHHQGPSPMQGHVMRGPTRLYAKTPPGRFGLVQTPSPTGRVGSTPPAREADLPSQYENRRSRSGGHSPMNTSPLSAVHRYCPPLPPTCMPITPNRPVTPMYVSSSPLTSVSYSQRPGDCPRRPIQVPYNRPGFR